MNPKELELRPTKHVVILDESPKSMTYETITTASTTPASSPESDTSDIIVTENPLHQSRAVNLLESFNEAAIPQNNSIADRIRPTFEIHLSPEEEITHSIVHDINWSFLTPIGFQQYDYELKKITVVLSIDELQNLGLGEFIEEARNLRFDEEAHLSYDELVDAKKKTNINERLSIEQWRNLEIALIKSPYGRTVIGYSINEEVYLKFWGHVFQLYYKPLKNLGYPSRDYQYPPRIDDTEKLMLDFCQNQLLRDFSLAARITGYFSITLQIFVSYVCSYLTNSYEINNFYYKYINYFSIGCSIIFLSILLTLQLPIIEKKFSLNIFNKTCSIIKSIRGNECRLESYLLLFFPNISSIDLSKIITYCILPIIFSAVYFNLKNKNQLFTKNLVNISKHTTLNFLYHTINYSSFNQTLMMQGLSLLINLNFYYNTADDYPYDTYLRIYNTVSYIILASATFSYLMQHPKNSLNLQYLSKYASNIYNGLSYSLFDASAFMFGIYISLSYSIFKKNTTTPKDYLDNSLFFIVLSASYLASINISFINSENIPSYSTRTLEKSEKPSLFKKTLHLLTQHLPDSKTISQNNLVIKK